MSDRKTSLIADEHYHVFNRGNNRQIIFQKESDYTHFFHLLYLANTTQSFNFRDTLKSYESVFSVKRVNTLVTIHAVCLMPNHFHLLITPLSDDGTKKFMQKLGTAYSKYFNAKYERTGGIFEGRYKAIHIDNDRYLKYLFSYIHLNPLSLKKSRVSGVDNLNFLKKYPFTSLPLYLKYPNPKSDLGLEKSMSTKLFAMYFMDEKDIIQELKEWIMYKDDVL